jgi:hypothetical protein
LIGPFKESPELKKMNCSNPKLCTLSKRCSLLLLLSFFLTGHLEAQQNLPPDSAYVTIKDGHLWHQGKRLRFWGAVGSFPGKAHADNEAVVKRLKNLGFNMVRFWWGAQGVAEKNLATNYKKGDGSPADLTDHFLWCCQQQGIKIWFAGLNQLGRVQAADVTIISDTTTSVRWQEAVGKNGTPLRNNYARIWDQRLHKLGIERMKTIANNVNQYTGLRYADDPNFAIWELSNEEWWFGHVTTRLSSIPAFFQTELLADWNVFLHKKYETEEQIKKAWLGFLPGESFDKNTITLVPLSKSAKVSDQRKALGVNIEDGIAQQYGAYDVNGKRGSDVIEFLTALWYKHKQEEHNALKAFGKSIALGSLIWDTGIGNEIQAQFLHQQADAVAHCTYISGFHHDPQAKRYPWFSGLEELPRMTWNDSWLEQNTTPGKPYFVYENQIHNPAKYRAEYPMRLVSLASINDWDAIVWHYFGPAPDAKKELPYTKALDYSTGGTGHPQGLHFQYDEVQQSAMTIAANVFCNFLLKPTDNPTVFIFGKKSLYNPAGLEYGGSYGKTKSKFMPTTYRYGSRLLIDTTKTDDEIITFDEYKSRLAGNKANQLEKSDSKWKDGRERNVYDARVYEINPIRPTNEIEYDWQKGHLKFEAPGVVSYTGFMSQYGTSVQFKNGISLTKLSVVNPKDMPYPVGADENYVEFSVVCADGKPIGESKKITISLVSTSFNSGFKLDHSKINREFIWGAKENMGMTVDNGHLPVLVSRVQATLLLPMLDGMKYTLLDFELKPIKSGIIKNGKIDIAAALPVFLINVTE